MSSKNKYDVYQWVLKVVKSAITVAQKDSAINLIRNYKRQYNIGMKDSMYNDLLILEITLF